MTIKKLPKTAYVLEAGETFTPLTAGQTMNEFTLKAAISGIVLGVLFGAANTYLGLKAGLTISTSIPVAVLTVVVFRAVAAMGGRTHPRNQHVANDRFGKFVGRQRIDLHAASAVHVGGGLERY